MASNPLLAIFKIKSFLCLWLAQVFSQLAGNLLNFVLLLRIAELTKSNTLASLFVIAISLPAFIFGTLAGVYVDNSEKKNVLFFCNLLRIVIVLCFVLTAETTVWIFVLAILISVVTQFFVPAEASLIPEFVKNDLLLAANSLFTLTFYSSVIVGFMLAGPFLVLIGIDNIFYLCAVLFLVATIFTGLLPGSNSWKILQRIILLRMNNETKKESFTHVVQKTMVSLKDGYEYIKNNKKVYDAIIIMASVQILIGTMAAISPGYAATVLRIKITDASLFIVAPAVAGMLAGSVIIGAIGIRKKIQSVINLGVILSGAFLTILSFLSRGKYSHIFSESNNILGLDILHLAIFFLFALGFASALVTVCANTVLQEVEGRLRSRVYGFLTAVAGIGAVVPVIAAGILSDLFGVVKVMLGLGLGILIFGIVRLKKN